MAAGEACEGGKGNGKGQGGNNGSGSRSGANANVNDAAGAKVGNYTDNDYFRMGAAVAVGELYDMAAFGSFLEDAGKVRSYLGSFGIRGMDDVDHLGIKGTYRRDFERLFKGEPAD